MSEVLALQEGIERVEAKLDRMAIALDLLIRMQDNAALTSHPVFGTEAMGYGMEANGQTSRL